MSSFPTVTDFLRPKSELDDYGTHHQDYGVGGYTTVSNVAAMYAIPVKRRRRLMMVGVGTDNTGNPALYWLFSPNNDTLNLQNNNNWVKVNVGGTTITGGLTYKGNFSAVTGIVNGGTEFIQDSPLSPVGSINGFFYVCAEAGAIDFGTGSQTFDLGDWAVYDGLLWRLLDQTTALTWALISDVPQILQDIVDGTIDLSLLDTIPTLASQAEAEAGTENTKYMSALRVLQSINKNAVGRGAIKIADQLAGFAVEVDKYYEQGGFLWRCVTPYTMASAGEFIEVNFDSVGLRFDTGYYSWTATADQTSYDIPGASSGEIDHLISLHVGGAPQDISSGIVTITGGGTGILIDADAGQIQADDVVMITYAKITP